MSIPKWIQLIEPNWLKNRKSLEREPWINILKAALQMAQNFIKVKKLLHKTVFLKNMSENIKTHLLVMKKLWKVVNHLFKVSWLFVQAKQAMKHWSGHHFNLTLLVGHFHQRLLMNEISEKWYFRKLLIYFGDLHNLHNRS